MVTRLPSQIEVGVDIEAVPPTEPGPTVITVAGEEVCHPHDPFCARTTTL